MCREIIQILCSPAWRFNELKAFLTSTKITASVLSSSNMHGVLWIAASTPDCNQVTILRGPAAS